MKRIVCLLVLLSLILIAPNAIILLQAQAATYTYDELNRLVRVEHDDGTVIEYTYDAAGSRTRQVVTVTNRPPVADAGPDQGVDKDAIVILNGSGSSDPDGDTLTFAWTQTAGDIEKQIEQAEEERFRLRINEDDIKAFINYAKKLMEHPEKLLINQDNLQAQQALFGLVFEEFPTYHDILNGTPKLAPIFKLSPDFQPLKSDLVRRVGFEPTKANSRQIYSLVR
ncbi:MAG: PKD domain-containing protein [Parcubacteria group bacterium Gr01-1014_48]|nr:MAG: PKD domain-containing protein [Parcubacteria group bacterium Greene0416_14]TSC73350.1 MAG: PKD domain-containing protein [Parcubacteria group bacterium Gr01-1014_48]TSD01315.1 MAG: PKD domain-containing protein [Parcubacteria group bacterium Greene1014_15]TSD08002.1 MAG: PKD domain-containing protein [Parcubacteria group bacterium Greene0714_4]